MMAMQMASAHPAGPVIDFVLSIDGRHLVHILMGRRDWEVRERIPYLCRCGHELAGQWVGLSAIGTKYVYGFGCVVSDETEVALMVPSRLRMVNVQVLAAPVPVPSHSKPDKTRLAFKAALVSAAAVAVPAGSVAEPSLRSALVSHRAWHVQSTPAHPPRRLVVGRMCKTQPRSCADERG
jgi:hypothetical protein